MLKLKILSLQGLTKFKIWLLKAESEGELQIPNRKVDVLLVTITGDAYSN